MKTFVIALTLVASAVAAAAQQSPNALPKLPPTVDQVLSLKRVAAPAVSPDGRSVAYTVRETNWEDNAYEPRSGSRTQRQESRGS
jgi:cytochrome c5